MTDALGRASTSTSTTSVLGSGHNELCGSLGREPRPQRQHSTQQTESKGKESQAGKPRELHDKSSQGGRADPSEARERDIEPHDRSTRGVRNTAQQRQHGWPTRGINKRVSEAREDRQPQR